MELNIAAMVLVSALLHPLWNALIKREKRIDGAFIGMVSLLMVTSFIHAQIMGYDLLSAAAVWPVIALSVAGQLLYGVSLIRTLGHGDLSVYYPIIRSSPLFIVIVGALFMDQTYKPELLVGIGCVLTGAFVLQYRRGSHIFSDPKTLLIALLAMSGTGIYSIADSRAMQAIEPPVLFFWVEVISLPVYVVLYRFFGLPGTRVADLFGWIKKPLLFLSLAAICYVSYLLILTAYGMGGDVAAVTAVRQASIPISVILGGLMFREGSIVRRLFASLLLAGGIVSIVLTG